MKRKDFIKTCGYSLICFPSVMIMSQSCKPIQYASSQTTNEGYTVAKSEFWITEGADRTERDFVLLQTDRSPFPICLYKVDHNTYVASLMECTHSNCELQIGGGIYTCPCHGSEFSNTGKVLEGPADKDLITFRTTTDDQNIFIAFS